MTHGNLTRQRSRSGAHLGTLTVSHTTTSSPLPSLHIPAIPPFTALPPPPPPPPPPSDTTRPRKTCDLLSKGTRCHFFHLTTALTTTTVATLVTPGAPVASRSHSMPGGSFVLGVQSRPGHAAHCVALSLATSPTPPSQVGLVMAGVALSFVVACHGVIYLRTLSKLVFLGACRVVASST
jgi:hypothetical protein